MKLYTINTVNNFMEMIYNPFAAPFAAEHPEITIRNIIDDSLLVDTREAGKVDEKVSSRMYCYAKAAEQSGADGIIVTCTSVNEATSRIRPFLSIPMINIEDPAVEEAVQSATRIGILGTIPTSPVAYERTIRARAQEMGKEIEIVKAVAEGAFDVLCSGDRAKHDEMVLEAMKELASKVDVIAFSQISMSMLPEEDCGVPVYRIGTSGFERIHRLMLENQKQ